MCVCTFQPGNFTGWGSEGVKGGPKEVLLVRVSLYILPAFMGFTVRTINFHGFHRVSLEIISSFKAFSAAVGLYRENVDKEWKTTHNNRKSGL